MKKVVVFLAILGLSSAAMAGVFSKCAGCHGQNGEKHALGKSKIIKDLTKAQIVEAIHGYKAGTYGGAMKGVMKGQVAKLSEADIKAISEKIGK